MRFLRRRTGAARACAHTVYVKTLYRVGDQDYCGQGIVRASVAVGVITEAKVGSGPVVVTNRGAPSEEHPPALPGMSRCTPSRRTMPGATLIALEVKKKVRFFITIRPLERIQNLLQDPAHLGGGSDEYIHVMKVMKGARIKRSTSAVAEG